MIHLKTEQEIEIMAEAGRILADILRRIKQSIEFGKTTIDLDKLAYSLCKERGVKPAFLGYQPTGVSKPFPATICASINEEIVHGIPSNRVLEEGDILTVDMGVVHKDFYSDSAFTVGVGSITKEEQSLLESTQKSLELAIAQAVPGNTLGDIGATIAEKVRGDGFSVVKNLVGHGIGKNLHEDPQVFNVGKYGEGEILNPGMVLAIEPMVALGKGEISSGEDGVVQTADGSVSAHFEHTVAITESGPQALTL